jgi:exonuclease SbcC
MKPLLLTLKGFCGIRDGLRRETLTLDLVALVGDAQLVAIAGANGRGKTTIMDNMHPYLTMPSHDSMAGQERFSYYDHVYLPENEKDLVWEHDGVRYRSQIIIRMSGKRKTEAYLFVGDKEKWKPYVCADGIKSDGKIDTYERGVEAICGSQNTFFTSAFSAQGKRQLTSYKNAEIKTLLTDLLGLEEIRQYGLQASEIVRSLKKGLLTIRQEQAELERRAQHATDEQSRLADSDVRLHLANSDRQAAYSVLDKARLLQATLAVEREQAERIEQRRKMLQAERQSMTPERDEAIRVLAVREQRERTRLARIDEQIASRNAQVKTDLTRLGERRDRLSEVCAIGPRVRRAANRLPLARQVLLRRTQIVDQKQAALEQFRELLAKSKTLEGNLTSLEREAGQAALRASELAQRFALTNEVPCAGTDLQGRCKLLGNATEAEALMPSADLHVSRLAQQREQLNAELSMTRASIREYDGASDRMIVAVNRETKARSTLERLAELAARVGEVGEAELLVQEIDQRMAALVKAGSDSGTVEEKAACHEINAAIQSISEERMTLGLRISADLQRIDHAMRELPTPFDEQRWYEAMTATELASRNVEKAEDAYALTIRDLELLKIANREVGNLQRQVARYAVFIQKIETELGAWILFAKCFGNDGIIALSIDDAGPALAGLTNDLLLACYGSRFTVSIRTLLGTVKGDQREGFDIEVYDAQSGESKSVSRTSGGERVWINECLVRAIALYLAQNAGRRYTTLFSDEGDGSLDPLHKRMLMAMKREVLRLGGYGQEFYISQTPELTTMADLAIDLELMRVAT